MDPVLIIALGLIVLLIAVYVVYKVNQGRRRKQEQAELEKLPEPERQVRLAQEAEKKKWGCLSAFAGLALIGNSLLAILAAINSASDATGAWPVAFVAGVLGAVVAGFIYWGHKRWAVYVYGALLGLSGLIGVLTAGLAGVVQAALPLVLLYIAAKQAWAQPKPAGAGTAAAPPVPGAPGVQMPQQAAALEFPQVDLAALQAVPTLNVPPALASTGPRLEIKTGDRSGSIIPVTGDLSIGRGADNDLALNDGRVSRQHLRLRFAQGAWFAQDQNSSTGTLLNGQRVTAARLQADDEITLGDTVIVFRT